MPKSDDIVVSGYASHKSNSTRKSWIIAFYDSNSSVARSLGRKFLVDRSGMLKHAFFLQIMKPT